MPRDGEGEGRDPEVAAYAIKIPPFWPSDPKLWFTQVESQFRLRGITAQETKFHHVLANLSQEIATEVRDLLINPPEENPYEVLKATLIKRTTLSEQRRLQQLLSAEDLGDQKPTQLLRKMQQLLGDKAEAMDPSLLRGLFLQRLPSNVRMILASTAKEASLTDLAEMADRVMEVISPSIATVATPQTTEVKDLKAEVASLRRQLSDLKATGRRRSTSRSKRRTQSRSRSPSQPRVCWYHRRFGDAARKCTPPCKQGNDRASS